MDDNKRFESATARLPCSIGEFQITVYRSSEQECIMLSCGEIGTERVIVRFHSECLTGDVFGSLRCDCQQQLHQAMRYIANAGGGLLFYLRQEGRGIGIYNKVQAYYLQEGGLNTVDANLSLGLPVDNRTYDLPIQILGTLGIRSVRLMTNNPDKVRAFDNTTIAVDERIPLDVGYSHYNHHYLLTKKTVLGHLLDVPKYSLEVQK